jgi:hypothetical protein
VKDVQHSLINTLLAIEMLLLVLVMFGGESLLRLSQGSLTDHTERYFRAGHAHAGVLGAIGMVIVLILPRTGLSSQGILFTWMAWVSGVLLMSGGFFVHAYTGTAGEASVGTWMTAAGGVVLGIVATIVALQLLRNR